MALANITVSVTEPNVTVSSDNVNVSVSSTTTNVSVGNAIITTDAEIRAALSNVSPILYDSNTGVISFDTSGFVTDNNVIINNTTTGVNDTLVLGSNQTLTADAIIEGSTNQFFTTSRFNTSFATKTSDDLTEGSTNFYATTSRIHAAMPSYTGALTNLTGNISTSANIDTQGGMTIFGDVTSNSNITTTANISGNYILGNVSQATGGYGDSDVISLFGSYSNIINTSANVIATSKIVAGSQDFINILPATAPGGVNDSPALHITPFTSNAISTPSLIFSSPRLEANGSVMSATSQHGASQLRLYGSHGGTTNSITLEAGQANSGSNHIGLQAEIYAQNSSQYANGNPTGTTGTYSNGGYRTNITFNGDTRFTGPINPGGTNYPDFTSEATLYGWCLDAWTIRAHSNVSFDKNMHAGANADSVHTITGNLDVTGNITATGNLNYQNVTDLYVTDQSITLNANAATDATSSIIINRPVAGANTVIRWNETSDKWEFSNDGNVYYPLPTNSDDLAEGSTNLYFTTAAANSAIEAHTGNIANLTGLLATTGNVQFNADTDVSGLSGLTFDSSTNNLGLGTPTPGAALHIRGTSNEAQIFMTEYNGTSSAGIDLRTFRAGGTEGSPTVTPKADRIWESLHYTYDGVGSSGDGVSTGFQNVFSEQIITDPTIDHAANLVPVFKQFHTYLDGDATTTPHALMRMRSNGDIQFNMTNAFSYTGAANTVIANDGTITTSGNVDVGDNFFVGDLDGAVVQDVRNETGATLSKGKAVYLTGSATGDNPHVALADADDSAKMPALGIVYSDIANASVGQVVTSGVINVASHGFTQGADLFVSTTAGDLTTTAPTGNSNALQKIGKVVSANHILVQGAFRQNATPNLDANTIFIGNSTNQASTVNLNSLSSSIITDKRLEGDRFSGGNVVVPIEQYIFSTYTYIKFSSANDPHLPNGTKIFIQDTDANNPLANGSINSDNIFYTRKSTSSPTYYILYLDEALQNISTVSVPTTSPANANVTFGSVLANGPITMSAGTGVELAIGSNAYSKEHFIRNNLIIGESANRNSKLDLSGDATITNFSGNAALTLVNNINSTTVPTQLVLKQNKNAGTTAGVAGDSLSVIQTQGVTSNITQSNTSVQDAQAFNNGTLTEDSISFSGGQIFTDGTEVVYNSATDGDVTPLNGRTFFLKYNTGDGGRYELFDDSGFTTGSRRITNGVFRSSGVGQVQTTTTSAGSIKTFANVLTKMTTPTLGSEDAEIDFRLMKAGTETSTLLLKSTEANINVPINSNSNITTSGTFSGDASGLTNVPAGDSFGTITVSGQTNIQASQANAVLDIASSGAITLTTSGNTLTIGGSGSAYGNAEVTEYLASATSVGNVAFTGNLIVESGNTSYSPSSYEGNVTSGTIDRVVFSSDPGFYEGQPILFSGTINSNLTFLNGNVYYVKGAGVSNSYSLFTDASLLTGLTSGLGTESPNSLAGTVRNESNQHNEFYGNVDISRGAHLNVHSIKSYVPGGTFSMNGIRATDVGVGNYFLPDTGGTTEGATLTAHSDGAATWNVGLDITSDSSVDVITVTEARNSSVAIEERFKRARGSTSSPSASTGGSAADRIHEVEYYGHDGTDYLMTFGEHVYVDTSVASVAANIMPLTKEFYCEQDGDVNHGHNQSIMKLRANRHIEFNANGTRGFGTQGNANVQMDGSIYSAATVDALNLSSRQFVQLKNYTTTEINALSGMAAGDTVFNTTESTICFYNGSAWHKVTSTAL